ncbi:MAG: VWA domain-containing protein [Oceanicoccus sp.]
MTNRFPQNRSDKQSLAQFLDAADKLPIRAGDSGNPGGRLIFALDATASRQPSWDRACHLQAQMFRATDQLGGLQLQLCYYRGFNEFHTTPWLTDSQSLLRVMTAVQCLGGFTQLDRVLAHCTREHNSKPIQAVVIIGDAVEESVDKLCSKAGKLGMLGVPLFMFQEGRDSSARQCFQQMAVLSKGAYATFDEHSANGLAELLGAVATFASGGYDALQQLKSPAARQLLQQLES